MKYLLPLLLLFSLPVQAQQMNCNTHEFVRDYLTTEHGETVIGRGISSRGEVIEVYYSNSKQTWTLVVSTPAISCVLGDGEFWEIVAPKAGETES